MLGASEDEMPDLGIITYTVPELRQKQDELKKEFPKVEWNFQERAGVLKDKYVELQTHHDSAMPFDVACREYNDKQRAKQSTKSKNQ